VATNSAADSEIGELIADVMDKVGKDGVITVEESKTMQFETEFVKVCSLIVVIFRLTSSQCRSDGSSDQRCVCVGLR